MQFCPMPEFTRKSDKPNTYFYNLQQINQQIEITDKEAPEIEGFLSKYSQLKYVANFLRGCYIEYALTQEPSFTNVFRRKRSQILKGISISTKYLLVFCNSQISKKSMKVKIKIQKLLIKEKD